MPPHRLEIKGFNSDTCELVSITPGDNLEIKATNESHTEVVGLTLDPDDETITPGVAFLLPSVNDADMNATPGKERQVIYNEADSKVYVCTVTDATAATWSALN